MSGPDSQDDARRLTQENRYLREELAAWRGAGPIVGTSPALLQAMGHVRRAAASDAAVLISGEAGTGKSLLARAVHAAGPRAQRLSIHVDCTALRTANVEEVLADRFTLSGGSTLILDEVGELSRQGQAQLLRVLQDSPLADVRIVATSNRDLRQAVRGGSFREDLHHRLAMFIIEVPPLRTRADDIPALARLFVDRHCPRLGRRVDGIDPDTLAAFRQYPWPGNVRELGHVIERALMIDNAPLLKVPREMLAVDAGAQHAQVATAATGSYRALMPGTEALDDLENTGLHHVQREHILRVLNATHWVIEGNSGAALKLGLKPATLRHRMKKLGIARVRNPPSP
jgi:transcriptional regulator with GAF, ATPase, and Fis domain